MALLADGIHMATHAGALTIAALAYLYARRHAHDRRFGFGTAKVGDLAGFASAVILAMFALMIGYESLLRLAAPVPIRFNEAIAVAVLGLVVNLLSASLLHQGEDHDHHHHGHEPHAHLNDNDDAGHIHHTPDRRDHNLRSAYFHVLADALTSVLAIAGLLAGRSYGWVWMDPLMGIVGAIVIARWSWGLLPDAGDRIVDLHLWRVGPGHMAAIVAVVTDRPQPPDSYKAKLSGAGPLSHVSIEVHPCQHERLAA
jgi:cation diffusion facilitator family transporter